MDMSYEINLDNDLIDENGDIYNDIVKGNDDYAIFKQDVLTAIEVLRKTKRRPDNKSIFEYLQKSLATNVNENTINQAIAGMMKDKYHNKQKIYAWVRLVLS